MHTCIVILGPTASGKTSLSIRLARQFHGVVISADSRQVYRGMNIGTGKVTKREMAGVPHYVLDVASPRGQYSVARYVADVRRVLRRIPETTPIFLVGGSPFYIDAVTKPGSFSSVPPNQVLRRRLEKWSTARLIARLRQLDTSRVSTIDTANRRRLIRAIEIASVTTPPPSITLPPMRHLTIGIVITKQKLHANIDRRVDVRMQQGMVREVQRLHDAGVSWKTLDAFGLEYRFLARYLRGGLTKTEAVQQLKQAIKDFAKRQMTWWKRDATIHWIDTSQQAVRLVTKFLN